MKIYVTKTHIADNNVSELDFTLYDKFGFDRDAGDGGNEFVEITDKLGRADSEPIEIDSLIEILKSLKEKGSNYVQLDYHCDHLGYDISGYDIRLSTKDEIEKYELENKLLREKRRKMLELQQEINKLKNE